MDVSQMYTGMLLGERCTDSGAGPVVPCRGTEWVVSTARANRVVDWVYPGYVQWYCQGPTHAFTLVPRSIKP